MSNFIVATEKIWNIENFHRMPKNIEDRWELVSNPEVLDAVAHINKPRYIFFPHWSWLIPFQLYEQFECVVFHMTDLPFGRGPEPLQHLIALGYGETKLSAIKVVKNIDAGPIYLKQTLCLEGSAEEIYMRCSDSIFNMIKLMVDVDQRGHPLIPEPQEGEPTFFTKRTKFDSQLPIGVDLKKLYDHIRMLDAESYQAAYIDRAGFKFEFKNAILRHDRIEANVVITEEEEIE